MTKILIPLNWTTPPLTQNGLRRLHHHAEAKAKAQAKSEARWAIRAAKVRPIVGAEVTLHCRVPDRRVRDVDGPAPTLKVVLDALVAEGVLPDDTWVNVPAFTIRFHPPEKGLPPVMWLELKVLTEWEKGA